jgi:hypothetical protein
MRDRLDARIKSVIASKKMGGGHPQLKIRQNPGTPYQFLIDKRH